MEFAIIFDVPNFLNLSNRFKFSPPVAVSGTTWRLGIRKEGQAYFSVLVGRFKRFIDEHPVTTEMHVKGSYKIFLKSFEYPYSEKHIYAYPMVSKPNFDSPMTSNKLEFTKSNEIYDCWQVMRMLVDVDDFYKQNREDYYLIEDYHDTFIKNNMVKLKANVKIRSLKIAKPTIDTNATLTDLSTGHYPIHDDAKLTFTESKPGCDLILKHGLTNYYLSSQIMKMSSPVLARRISQAMKSKERPIMLDIEGEYLDELFRVLHGVDPSESTCINVLVYKSAREFEMAQVMYRIEKWLLDNKNISWLQKAVLAFRHNMLVVKDKLSNGMSAEDKKRIITAGFFNEEGKKQIREFLNLV